MLCYKLINVLVVAVIFLGISRNSSAQEIYIAYTTNLNCNLEACNCGGNDLGGMVQLANAISSLRLKFPDLILLDSGDFLKSYPLTDENALMIDLMSDLKYDAIAVGDQEFIEGINFLIDHYFQKKLPLTNANIFLNSDRLKNFNAFKIVQRGSTKIGVISVTFPETMDPVFVSNFKVEPPHKYLEEVVERIEPRVDMIVLLCHGVYGSGKMIAKEFPNIDIIITGHTQEKFAIIKERQLIVQAGYDGEYLGLIHAQISDSLFKVENTFIPVNSKYSLNKKFKAKVDSFYQEDSLKQ